MTMATRSTASNWTPTSSIVLSSHVSQYNAHYVRQAVTTDLSMPSLSDYWWPYPSWGAITIAAMPSTTSRGINVAVSSTSLVSSSNTASSSPSSSLIRITALPPGDSNLSYPPQSGKIVPQSSFNLIYLAPVFAFLGIIFGCLSVWLYFRWSARRQGGGHTRSVSFQPGPPYVSYESDYRDRTVDDEGQQDMETASLFAFFGSPSKHSIHGATYKSSQRNLWPSRNRMLSSHSREPGVAGEPAKTFPRPAIPFQTSTGERDPFLASPPRVPSVRSHVATRRSVSQRTAAGVASPSLSLFSVDQTRRPEDAAAYATIRHKSIRRSILEHLKVGSFRRAHAPKDDVAYTTVDTLEDPTIESPSAIRFASLRQGEAGGSRSAIKWMQPQTMREVQRPHKTYSPVMTPKKGRVGVRSSEDETQWVAGSGFRIVREDPGVNPAEHGLKERATANDSNGSIKLSKFWNSVRRKKAEHQEESAGKAEAEASMCNVNQTVPEAKIPSTPSKDEFALKCALQVEEEQRGDELSPKGPSTLVPRPSMPRIDSSILPRSPPLLMSPPLASTLFFTSPSASMLPNLFADQAGSIGNMLPFSSVVSSPSTPVTLGKKKVRKTKKLKTSKPPPLLPFPSYTTNSPDRIHVTKPVGAGTVLPTTPPRRNKAAVGKLSHKRAGSKAGAPQSSPRESTSAVTTRVGSEGRREGRSGDTASRAALCKVTEIISRSYSERNI